MERKVKLSEYTVEEALELWDEKFPPKHGVFGCNGRGVGNGGCIRGAFLYRTGLLAIEVFAIGAEFGWEGERYKEGEYYRKTCTNPEFTKGYEFGAAIRLRQEGGESKQMELSQQSQPEPELVEV